MYNYVYKLLLKNKQILHYSMHCFTIFLMFKHQQQQQLQKWQKQIMFAFMWDQMSDTRVTSLVLRNHFNLSFCFIYNAIITISVSFIAVVVFVYVTNAFVR